jgi:diguanylate cyclase (GGDEF)-like protein/putative nucleotidyltransferase with HDIG domain
MINVLIVRTYDGNAVTKVSMQNNADYAATTLSPQGERVAQTIERHGLQTRLAGLCGNVPLGLVLLFGDERIVLVQHPEPSAAAPRLVVPVPHRSKTRTDLELVGVVENAPLVATVVAQWLGDVLALEGEVGNLAQEIVHSYEELHLLYHLGGALSVILNASAACTLIVDAVLDPLDAVYATITLKGEGDKHIVHRSTNRDECAETNRDAQISTSLQVGGTFIGTLAVYGKRSGGDFSSGDAKLLDGVASVSAPVLHNAQLYEAACQQAQTDSLTGVYNHRRIQEHIDTNLDWARQYGAPISIILVEIDHLDLFSDVYGVAIGNMVQRIVADSLRVSIRPGDAVGSYGEDKFVLVLPNTDAHDALQTAQQIVATVRAREVVVEHSRLAVRVSLGVASFPEHAAGKQRLIAAAIKALREAVASGGGCVRAAGHVEKVWEQEDETFSVLHGLVQAVDAKDHYTQEHSETVTDAALLIAEHLQLPDDMRYALRVAGMLHDVGKIGIPDNVLKKPGKLTAHEFTIMKHHVVLSEVIVRGVPHPPGVLDAIAHHHERYDGTGYPYGKRGDDIPLLGRILSVADAYSAMCIDRPYRKGLIWSDIKRELERGAGTQFDPCIVALFIQAMDGTKSALEHSNVRVPVMDTLSNHIR